MSYSDRDVVIDGVSDASLRGLYQLETGEEVTLNSLMLSLKDSQLNCYYLGDCGAGNFKILQDATVTISNTTANGIYGGNVSRGHFGRNLLISVAASSVMHLFGAVNTGVDGSVTMEVSDRASAITGSFQGGAVNADVKGDSIVSVTNATLGDAAGGYFFGYAGVRGTGDGLAESVVTLSGQGVLKLDGANLVGKNYLFAGGYGFGVQVKGSENAIAVVKNGTQVQISGITVSGNTTIYGGGRAASAIGQSVVENGSEITCKAFTVEENSVLNLYGGGHNDGNGSVVDGGSKITLKYGTYAIDGALNLYGGGNGGKSGKAVVNGGSFILIGNAGRKTNITLNNIYGGGAVKAKVNGGSRILFSGGGAVQVNGVISGDSSAGEGVSGVRQLEFKNFRPSLALNTVEVKNFDVLTADGLSVVSFNNQLDLSSVYDFEFQFDSIRKNQTILSFENGVSDWETEGLSAQLHLNESALLTGSQTLIYAQDSMDAWQDAEISWHIAGFGEEKVKTGGVNEQWQCGNYLLSAELVDLDDNGAMDALKLTLSEAPETTGNLA